MLSPGASRPSLTPSPGGKVPEAFRLLSMKLMSNGTSNVSSLLIANFERGETAAEVASGLAIMLAHAGKHVVLIDANTRQPILGKWFQAENKEGLTDWLSNGVHDPNLAPVEWVPGLRVMPAGIVNGNAVPESAWPRMADLIRRIESQSDVLVVAGPPLSESADSLFLASHVGGVLAVAERGKTHRSVAEATIENLRSLGVQVLGLVLADGAKPHVKTARQPAARKTPPSRIRLLSAASIPSSESRDKVRGPGTNPEARSGETSSGKSVELGTSESKI